MALKAEAPLVDYIEVSSSVLRFKEKEKAAVDPPRPVRSPAKRDPGGRGEHPAAGVSPEEPGSSWQQEYLIAESSGRGQPVCMVCGGRLSASGPAAARQHIRQHHAHSLDFSLEEKRNILEAWSEGEVLPAVEAQPCPAGSPRKSKRPAEIEVLLDPEEQPASRTRKHPKARCEVVHLDPERRSRVQQRRHSSSSAKDMRSAQPVKAAGKEWLSECGVPGSAPAEIRIFTDGTFPAGFALKLYCRTQPEPPQDTETKPSPRKRRVVCYDAVPAGCHKGAPFTMEETVPILGSVRRCRTTRTSVFYQPQQPQRVSRTNVTSVAEMLPSRLVFAQMPLLRPNPYTQ